MMSSSLVLAVSMMIGWSRSLRRIAVADLEAVDTGQHDVEQHQIEVPLSAFAQPVIAVRAQSTS